ncbi:MAG: GAF domain-containing sensor histidine kinase [Actinomycetes bacterium]|jgi:signal transduction histidine kinase|nr:GAF domain-containing sensor histidine kinase [Acidimicrobiia bacterium]
MPSRHRLTALGEIIRALSRGDTPDEVVKVALQATRDAVGADVVSFAVPEANRLRFSIVEGDTFTVTTWPKDSGGLTERVLNSEEPLSIPDLMASGIPLRRLVGEEAPHARSYVGVPARSNKRVVGVLSVQSYRPGVFGVEDVELIAEVGRQVADAIVSSRRLARIQRRLSQLDRAQRERTDFLVGVAHDMRSPLAGIIGFARILEELDSVAMDPMASEAVRFIAAEAQRLSDLVSQLVDLGRVDLGETTLDLEQVDLAKVAAQVVEVARTRFPAHRFALRAEEPVTIEGDLLRLHRVIANLVDNAAIHGPSGGLVTIEVSEEPGEALLAVSDRGPGVPPADRDRIFERFVRLDGSHAGTGIGLYLVKALVDAHGGKVTVTDAPGGGARFEVRLPKGSSREGHPVP